MFARRLVSACAVMLLSACSVGACALIVGPPDGHHLFEAGVGAAADGSSPIESSTAEASSSDASVADGPAGDQASAEAGEEDAREDAPSDQDANNPCEVSGTNLIENGDFSDGGKYWAIVSGTGTIVDAGAGELCVSASAGQQAILGWTMGIFLAPSASYTFSYCAWAMDESVPVIATVGHSSGTYATDYQTTDAVGTSWKDFAHPFTVSGGDDSAGLSFNFTSSVAQEVCFQAVGVVENDD